MKSINFWKNRYAINGNSGLGSKNDLLKYKVDFINTFIKKENINSILDFGHGDLEVASRINIKDYVGIDIFEPKNKLGLNLICTEFDKYNGPNKECVICLDVLYHILENEQNYMKRTLDIMMEKADRFIVIYAQDSRDDNFDRLYNGHLYNSKWIQYMNVQNTFECIYEQDFPQVGSTAKFFIYKRI